MSGYYMTTGDAAILCGVTPRTIGNLCDGGLLDHFTLPSGSRRVSRAGLARFLRAQGAAKLPPGLDGPAVLLAGVGAEDAHALAEALAGLALSQGLPPDALSVQAAPSLAVAAHLCGTVGVHALVAGTPLAAGPEAAGFVRHLAEQPGRPRLAALVGRDAWPASLAGFDRTWPARLTAAERADMARWLAS